MMAIELKTYVVFQFNDGLKSADWVPNRLLGQRMTTGHPATLENITCRYVSTDCYGTRYYREVPKIASQRKESYG